MRLHAARLWAAALLTLLVTVACGEARAGAWPLAPGETLAILKYEEARSDEEFGLDGDREDAVARVDRAVSLYVERGLGRGLTLQAKLPWTWGEDDAGGDYEGRGPAELGLRYAVVDRGGAAVSLYIGAVWNGDGRNAGYAAPGAGETDLEARLLAGQSFELLDRPAFVEAQVARLARTGLPDETRLDLTAGFEPSPQWLLLLQSYGGRTDADPQWLKLEASAVRRFGDWRLQAGWRASAAGRASPVESGPVFAVWRSF